MKKILFMILLLAVLVLSIGCGGEDNTAHVNVPPLSLTAAFANGLPTLAEFGSSTCVPCKQMKPILTELSAEYEGKANVVIVEVYDNPDLTRRHNIMAIPTQIFFSADGKEVFRHVGFFDKEKIVYELTSMGIE